MENKKRSRRDRILELINEKGSLTTAELSNYFQVTNETIRKDLHYLDSAGCIKKTHGRANCIGPLFTDLPSPPLEQYRNEKIKIAKSAARFLKNNAVFFIDSGSTASYLATLLDSFHSITVVTTSMLVANIMQSQEADNYLYLPSGFVNYKAMHIYGRSVERSLQDFRFTAAFFGSGGIRYHDGPTVLDPQEIAYRSIVANNSEMRVIMCDHSKFSIGGVAQYLSWNKVDYFITDSGVTPENLSTLGSHPKIIIENSFYTP